MGRRAASGGYKVAIGHDASFITKKRVVAPRQMMSLLLISKGSDTSTPLHARTLAAGQVVK